MKPHPIYLKAARGEYLAGKDLAQLIRDALKSAFPLTKFSVTTKQTQTVNVRWFDGPSTKQVESIAGAYETRGFDGSIDLAHSNSLWLYPDGSAHMAHDSGTAGSMGAHAEVIESPRRPDAVLCENVSSGFVFCARSMHPFAYRRAIAEIRAANYSSLSGVDWSSVTVTASEYDGSGVIHGAGHIRWDGRETWLDCALSQLAHSYDLSGDDGSLDVTCESSLETVYRNAVIEASAKLTEAAPHIPVLCW